MAAMLKFIFLLLGIAVGSVVCFVNLDPVVINIPFGSPMQVPQAFVLVLAFFFGVLTMFFQFSLDIFRKTMEVRKLNRRLRQLESEITELRPKPSASAPIQ
jgi:uncharacterized integral membrane protein